MKARIEFEDAETAFAAEDYPKAVWHLTEAEKLLEKWTPKVGYLLIVSLDKTLNYETPDTNELQRTNFHIKKYMEFANTAQEIDMDKFREIVAIEKMKKTPAMMVAGQKEKLYLQGKGYYDNKDYANALLLYEKSAFAGNVVAMDALSDMYRDAVGVEKDYQKSLEWDKKAAAQGYGISMSDIGSMYLEGEGVTQDITEATKWFSQSVECGSVQGMIGLGHLSHNFNDGFAWYKKAADKGSVIALFYIGSLYSNQKNYPEAAGWYKKAADKGSAYAMAELGYMYYQGHGVKKDYDEAIGLYEKAIALSYEMGDAEMLNMGHLYYLKGNYAKSMEWYMKAYEKGVPATKNVAKDWIAVMYEEGQGVARDKKLAKEWRKK